MAGHKTPQRAGRNLGIEIEKSAGQFFSAGLLAGLLAGLSPTRFCPARSPAKGTELLTLNAHVRIRLPSCKYDCIHSL